MLRLLLGSEADDTEVVLLHLGTLAGALFFARKPSPSKLRLKQAATVSHPLIPQPSSLRFQLSVINIWTAAGNELFQ